MGRKENKEKIRKDGRYLGEKNENNEIEWKPKGKKIELNEQLHLCKLFV